MGVVRHFEPAEVWDYYIENYRGYRDSMYEIIAEYDDYGIIIIASTDSSGGLEISVSMDGVEMVSDYAISETDCIKTVTKIYDEYLSESLVNTTINKESEDDDAEIFTQEEENQILIDEREDELDTLVSDFCNGVIGFNSRYELTDEQLDDVKEHFLDYLYRKHGVNVYRPMYLEDEKGEDFFEEYPYPCMVFDDEDNPIYQK